MSKMMKVAIVDDEKDMRLSISQWLSLSGYDTESFASAAEALGVVGPDYPGIVITDIRMPGMDGITLLKKLMGSDSALPVMMITGHGDVPIAMQAMRLGAFDFLEKPFDPDILLIKATLAIELFTDKILIINRYRLLTNKEIQVFNCVINGEKNRIIADKLFISLPTVEAHRSRVMKKMQAESVADLVRFSMLTNLVA